MNLLESDTGRPNQPQSAVSLSLDWCCEACLQIFGELKLGAILQLIGEGNSAQAAMALFACLVNLHVSHMDTLLLKVKCGALPSPSVQALLEQATAVPHLTIGRAFCSQQSCKADPGWQDMSRLPQLCNFTALPASILKV